MDLALVVLSHTTIPAHFTTGFRWLLYSLLPAVYCRPDRARLANCIHSASSFPIAWFFLKLGANSPLRRDAWLSVVLDKCCSSLLCLGFLWEGSPEHMVGVDLAGGQPIIKLECCIWSVTAPCARHYQWKLSVQPHQEQICFSATLCLSHPSAVMLM